MLQSMRNKIKGLVAFFLIGLLTIPLALVGVENFFYGGNHIGEAAEVNERVIFEREVQIAIGRERQRLESQLGDNLPTDFLTDENLREPAIEGLIQREILASLAEKGNMTFSDKDVDRVILSLPDFQIDGKFDSQRFIRISRSIGHTPATFRELLKEDMLVNEMQNAILSSDFITPNELHTSVALSRQNRDFAWISLPLGDLPKSIEVTEEEVSAYYEENKSSYLSQEQVAIEYIALSVDDLLEEITVDEESIRQQYLQIVNDFKTSTTREAAHIMIEGDDETAQEKITAVTEKLAVGEDFAALAKEYSDDFGTRDNGGNLGLSTGDGFPEAFEEALVSLKEGEVSEATVIDNATHFIKLVSLTEKTAPTYESQKLTIETEIKRARAEERFVEDVQALEELSYNAQTLAEVADQLGLPLGNTGLFSRTGVRDDVLQDQRVVNAAFSTEVTQEGHSSPVLAISADSVVVLKSTDYQPVRMLSLEEKQQDIVAQLQEERAKEQLLSKVAAIKEKLESGADIEALVSEEGLSFTRHKNVSRNASDIPLELVSLVFDMPKPEEGKAAIQEQYLDNGQYVIVQLTKVTGGDISALNDIERTSLKGNLSNSIAGDEYRAWQSDLRDQASISIYRSDSSSL